MSFNPYAQNQSQGEEVVETYSLGQSFPNNWRSANTQNNTRIIVEDLSLIESGSFHTMMYRPLEIELVSGALDDLSEAIARNGNRYNQNIFNRTLGAYMYPSTVGNREVSIANGFDSRRTLFVMRLRSISTLGSDVIYIIHGYASANMATQIVTGGTSTHVDEDMELYVNGFLTLKDVVSVGSNGVRSTNRMLIDQISVTHGNFVNTRGVTVDPVTLRPYDVLGYQSSQFYGNNLPGVHGSIRVQDDRNRVVKDGNVTIRRQEANPTNFMLTTATAYSLSQSMTGDFAMPVANYYDNAQSTLVDKGMAMNPFFAKLQAYRQEGGQNLHNFTLKELMLLAENRPPVTYHTRGELERTTRNVAEQSRNAGMNVTVPIGSMDSASDWNAATVETQIAATLDSLLPEAMLSKCIFCANINAVYTPGIGWNVTANGRTFEGIQVMNAFNSLSIYLRQQVLPLLSTRHGSGEMPITIVAYKDIFTLSRYEISFNNGQAEPFEAPTFADSLYGLLVAPENSYTRNVAQSTETVLNRLSSDFGPSIQNQFASGGFGIGGTTKGL